MYQKFIAIGRLGRDWELRSTKTGTSVANNSLAIDHGWGDNKQTLWMPLVAFGSRAEALQKYTYKGNPLHIEGTLTENKWTDKNGIEKVRVQCVVDGFTFLSSKKKSDSADRDYARAVKAAEERPPF